MAANYYYYWLNQGSTGEEPNELLGTWFNDYLYSCYGVAAEEIDATHKTQIQFLKDNLLAIMPVQDIVQHCAVANRIMNFPTEGGYNLDDCRAGEDLWINE